MKFITRLEKSKIFWWLLLLCTVFFLIRLPSTIEPYWYGDEGVYETIGQALNKDHLLYRDIWDNKPPLLYSIYALVNGDQQTVRFISLFAGLFSLLFLFYLSQKLFSSLKISVLVISLYTILFAPPLLEGNIANAENFMLLPITAAGLFIYQIKFHKNLPSKPNHSYLSFLKAHLMPYLPGILLGIAFLFKIVALFDFLAFGLFIAFIQLKKLDKKHIFTTFITLKPFILGFFIPIGITFIYFASHQAVKEFVTATFFGNISYVGYQNTFLGIPQGLLLIKSLLLFLFTIILFKKRHSLSSPALFILLWTAFSLFNVFFSGRPYTHYVLVMLPSFCLLFGLFLTKKMWKTRISISVSIIGIVVLILNQFHPNFNKAVGSYQNAFLFITNQKSLTDYQAFFDHKTPRDYALAHFIATRTTADDAIFVWGDSPQIYALAHKTPPSKYTVAYHITQSDTSIKDVQDALNYKKPKYIITLSETRILPFSVSNYIMLFTIQGATIYERIF